MIKLVGRFEKLDMVEQVKGAVSFESAHVIDSYPYGGYRTEARVWIETKTTGVKTQGDQRQMFVTLNPKTNKWNNPRKGTYSRIVVLYIDSNGHIQPSGISESCSFESLESFIKTFEIPLNQKINFYVCLKGAYHGARKWGGKTQEELTPIVQGLEKAVRFYDEVEPTPEPELEPLVRTEGIYQDELSGRKLKKALGLYKANRRYHNKHVRGSGNFGFTCRISSELGDFLDLSGNYNDTGKLYCLDISYRRSRHQRIDLAVINSYDKLIALLTEFIKPELELCKCGFIPSYCRC